MDGNGRWAKQRRLPRVAGHRTRRRGGARDRSRLHRARRRVPHAVRVLERELAPPEDEVSILMDLFVRALEQEVAKLHENGIRFKVVGDLSRFDRRIRELIADGEALTAAQHATDADHRRELRRPLGHRAGGAALFRGASRTRSRDGDVRARGASSRFSRWPTRRSRISSSAPAASSGSRTSCSGSSRTPSSTSRRCCGPISTRPRSTPRSRGIGERERRFGRTSEQVAAAQGA